MLLYLIVLIRNRCGSISVVRKVSSIRERNTVASVLLLLSGGCGMRLFGGMLLSRC